MNPGGKCAALTDGFMPERRPGTTSPLDEGMTREDEGIWTG